MKGLPEFRVPSTKTVAISLDEPRVGRTVHLRPKTVAALKTVAGVPVRKPVRLLDEQEFEVMNGSESVKGLIALRGVEKADIGGTPRRLARALIASIPDTGAVPDRVTIVQRRRAWNEVRPLRSLRNLPPMPPKPGPPDIEWLRQFGDITRLLEFMAPDWLKSLRVYVTTLVYDDVIVENAGTLVIDQSITSLTANNFRMHGNARVVQKSPDLMVTISGQLQGSLP